MTAHSRERAHRRGAYTARHTMQHGASAPRHRAPDADTGPGLRRSAVVLVSTVGIVGLAATPALAACPVDTPTTAFGAGTVQQASWSSDTSRSSQPTTRSDRSERTDRSRRSDDRKRSGPRSERRQRAASAERSERADRWERLLAGERLTVTGDWDQDWRDSPALPEESTSSGADGTEPEAGTPKESPAPDAVPAAPAPPPAAAPPAAPEPAAEEPAAAEPVAAEPAAQPPVAEQPVAEPASTDTGSGEVVVNDYQAGVLAATNAERAKAGIAPLQIDPCAQEFAQSHAQALNASGAFEHQDLGPVLTDCQPASGAAENIARGDVDPAGMVQMWMGSPGHRDAILNPGLTHIGVGAAGDGSTTGVQVFLSR